jgi:16S rRNA (cytosine967-C5)-methyltransferase
VPELFLSTNALDLAAAIVNESGQQKPADSILRSRLRVAKGLHPDDATAVSRLVFSYYRWFGWLDPKVGLTRQFHDALALADQFARDPKSFSDTEIVERTIPGFIHSQVAVSPEWARSLQAEPKLWLRARPGRGASLAAKLDDCKSFGEGPLADILQYRGNQDLFRTSEFHAGEFEIQDLSSQAVGLACGAAAGQTWWDACAGEGGKTLHLSDLMDNKGLIWATDIAEWRLKNLRRRAARAGIFNFRSRAWYGGPKLPNNTKFDGILVDAPCSGVGTWARNPHARWTLTQQDIDELAQLQKQLLQHVVPALKPGGKLIYAVCTLTRAETVEVAKAVDSFAGFKRLAIPHPLQADKDSASEFFLSPQDFGGNGMFIAAWQKQ